MATVSVPAPLFAKVPAPVSVCASVASVAFGRSTVPAPIEIVVKSVPPASFAVPDPNLTM